MSRKQEINAIYDSLVWILKGVCQCDSDPDTVWDVINLDELSRFINTVNDCWGMQDANSRYMNACYINEWQDFENIAEHIYEMGGRINRKMNKKGE